MAKKCIDCQYNFSGICASHSDGIVTSECPELAEGFDGLTIDIYGIEINYILDCDGYREKFPFLSPQ